MANSKIRAFAELCLRSIRSENLLFRKFEEERRALHAQIHRLEGDVNRLSQMNEHALLARVNTLEEELIRLLQSNERFQKLNEDLQTSSVASYHDVLIAFQKQLEIERELASERDELKSQVAKLSEEQQKNADLLAQITGLSGKIDHLESHIRRDRHYFIFSLPKSAAQALAAALDEGFLPEPFGKHYPASMSYPNGLHVDVPLSKTIDQEFPYGGWVHTHAPASFPTLDVLGYMGARYIVVIRNPIDQIAAYYCHVRKHLATHRSVPGHPALLYSIPMAPCRRDLFDSSNKVDAALHHLIEDGYLEACLRWITDWLQYRNPMRSELVKYEDFVASPAATLNRLSRFLAGCISFDEIRYSKALNALENYKSRSLSGEGTDDFYPRGWTGATDLRSTYLTRDHMASAVRVIKRFAVSTGREELLFGLYPELRAISDTAVTLDAGSSVAS